MLKQHTMSILKNFAQINQGIMVREGNVLRTMSIKSNVFATSPVGDTFERSFAIYNLNELLASMNLLNEPDIEFNADYILLKDKNGKSKIKYFYSSPNVVVAPPEKDMKFPEADVSFFMSSADFEQVMKAANIMSLSVFSITEKGVTVCNPNSVGNIFDVDIQMMNSTKEKFTFNIGIENMNIIPGDYEVSVSGKGLARFVCKSPAYPDLVYYIALNAETD